MDINIFHLPGPTELEKLLDSREPSWKERPLYYIETERRTIWQRDFENPIGRYDLGKHYENISLVNPFASFYYAPESDGITKFVLFRVINQYPKNKEYYFILSNVAPKIAEGDDVKDFIAEPELKYRSSRVSSNKISFLNKVFFDPKYYP